MDCFRIELFWLICYISSPATAYLHQIVGVRGQLMCGKLPLPDTTVRIVDKNFIGADTPLAETKTGSDGRFELEGGTSAFLTMNVHLKIYHDCNDKLPCQRRVDLQVPSSYVYRGSGVLRWFDAGTLNMSFPYPYEERSCKK